MKKICCLIVTYNPQHKTIENIDKVLSQSEKIVVIDNGSTDNTINIIKSTYEDDPRVSILMNTENLGIATALNIGIRYALELGYNWIATFDQDSSVVMGYFDSMSNAYDMCLDRNRVRIISPVYKDQSTDRVTSSDGILVHKLPKYANSIYRLVDFSMTSGNLIDSRLFAEVGFFNDQLFIDQVDHDFCLRCINAGYSIIESRHTILNHNLGEQTVHRFLNRSPVATNHSPLRRYYMARNRLYMYRKYFFSNTSWVIIDFIRFIKELIVVMFYENSKEEKFTMTLRGISDSLRNKYGKFGQNVVSNK